MPLTPFHMGPGLLIKGIIPGGFSLSAFALANGAMDLEPLFRLLVSGAPTHGLSHTLLGAAAIGCSVAAFGRPLIARTWRAFDRTSGDGPFCASRFQLWLGALLGTGSHLLLDAVMHPDVHPFLPFSGENPLLQVTWTQHVYLFCVLTGMVGMLLVLLRAVRQHKPLLTQ